MASYSAEWSVGPKTLSTTTVDTISLTKSRQYIQVANLSGTDPLLVSIGSAASAPASPSGLSTDVGYVPAGSSAIFDASDSVAWATGTSLPVVKVLGNSNVYLVQGVQV